MTLILFAYDATYWQVLGLADGKRTMADFAKAVGLLIRQPIDDTNLPGYYNVNFSWKAPPSAGAPPPQPGLGQRAA